MTFAHPSVLLLLLALPVLAWLRGRRSQEAAFIYSSVQLVKPISNLRRSRAGKILVLLRWLAAALLIVALARPRLVQSESTSKASGIDIAVAFDLSQSMAAEDFRLEGKRANRLTVAKQMLEAFIRDRPNDRIGLVAFAGRAYIASAITLDHDFLIQNLRRLEFDSISEGGTAIGAALATALNRLRELDSKSRIVILITDGQNNAGKVPPLTATQAAESLKVKVYTVGVGTRGSAPVPYRDQFGGIRYRMEPVDIDEPLLQEIAQRTGGKYYRAETTESLRNIYQEIDRLEKTESEVKRYHQYRELFPYLTVLACLLLLTEIILAHTVWRRLP